MSFFDLLDTIGDMNEPLTANDRCDTGKCGSAAMVRVLKNFSPSQRGVLDFCGHHYAKNEADLFVDGWAVTIDNRADLLPKKD